MNPTNPIPAVNPLRVPNSPGERRRRQGDADAFRRALQQDGGAPAEPDVGPDARAQGGETPARPALQPAPAPGRRDGGSLARHVDVVA
jgi:hypothetical protein